MTATALLGTAYRRPIVPTFDRRAAVYACWPPAPYLDGTTTHLLAISSELLGDTCVFPSTPTGEITWELLGHVIIRNHRAALRAAGYDLEVPLRVHA